MDMPGLSLRGAHGVVRPEVKRVAIVTVSMLRDLFYGTCEARYDMNAGRVHALSMYALQLIIETYEGAFRLHCADLPHAAAIAERALFEALVQLLTWQNDESKALKQWRMLPLFAYAEVFERSGKDAALVPPGVKRDRDCYAAENPDLPEPTREQFRPKAQALFQNAGWDAQQFRDAFYRFYDIPSLFAHARALGVEDFVGVDANGEWNFGPQHCYTDSNAQILASTGLALQAARVLAARYDWPPTPVEAASRLWDEALSAQPRDFEPN